MDTVTEKMVRMTTSLTESRRKLVQGQFKAAEESARAAVRLSADVVRSDSPDAPALPPAVEWERNLLEGEAHVLIGQSLTCQEQHEDQALAAYQDALSNLACVREAPFPDTATSSATSANGGPEKDDERRADNHARRRSVEVDAQTGLGNLHVLRGALPDALSCFSLAYERASEGPSNDTATLEGMSMSSGNVAMALAKMERWAEAKACYERQRREADAMVKAGEKSHAALGLIVASFQGEGMVSAQMGEFERAVVLWRLALPVAKELRKVDVVLLLETRIREVSELLETGKEGIHGDTR